MTPRPAAAWQRVSLPVRVTAVATGLLAVALALAGYALVATLRTGLVGSLDAAARQRADDVAALVAAGRTGPRLLPGGDNRGEVQVLAADGTVLASTPELADRPPLVPPAGGRTTVRDLSTAEDGDVRVLAAAAGPRTIVVVSPLDPVQQATGRLTVALAVGGPLLLALLAASMYVLVRYTLRTVERLRRQVAAVGAGALHHRVDVPAARDDVRALALTMNAMLARLESAAAAQRRFVADAAHELRSPLAALRAQLEVAARQDDPRRWAATAPRLLAETDRLGRLVEDLLALARLDETARPRPHQPVDLDDLVLTEVATVRAGSRVPISTAGVHAGLVEGDPVLLARVVRNLIDNAVRYAAGRVAVSVTAVDGQVELVVADDGPGIPPADRARVFGRFERLDQARGRDDGGSGLGLAIVAEAVAAHGGTVSVQDNRPGSRFVLWLPGAGPG